MTASTGLARRADGPTDGLEATAPSWRALRPVRGPLLAWTGLVVVASLVGVRWRTDWKVKAPPLTGAVDWPVFPLVPVALLFGLWLARRLPGWCAAASWRRMLLVVALVSVAWGGALALVRGPSGLDRGLATPHEYPAVVDDVDRLGVGPFVETFTDPEVLAGYPVHVEGHPVGAALLFVGLDRIGLGGSAGAAAFLVLVGAAIAPLVLVAVREVAGGSRARQAAPFLAIGPMAIWTVTSADALFAAVGAAAVVLVVLASGRSSTWGRLGLGVAGGVAFGVGAQLSYGLVPLVLVPAVVAVARRRWDVLGAACAGGLLVLGGVGLAGFWWFDGLAATHDRYWAGIGARRPFAYFAPLGNPAALAICVGPAAVVAVARLRDRRLWLLVGGALAAVVVADLSGLSKAEVERIWLPFAPWLLVATAALVHLRSDAGGVRAAAGAGASDGPIGVGAAHPAATWSALAASLLAVQVVVAVTVESVVRTLW